MDFSQRSMQFPLLRKNSFLRFPGRCTIRDKDHRSKPTATQGIISHVNCYPAAIIAVCTIGKGRGQISADKIEKGQRCPTRSGTGLQQMMMTHCPVSILLQSINKWGIIQRAKAAVLHKIDFSLSSYYELHQLIY